MVSGRGGGVRVFSSGLPGFPPGGLAVDERPELRVAAVVPGWRGGIEGGHVDGLPPLAGRGPGVGLLQVGLDDVGVDLRGADAGVPEEFLHVADRSAALEHFGRARVAEAVDGDEVGQPGAVAVDDELLPQYIAAAVSYAERYQHLTAGTYEAAVMPPTTEQVVIMLASHFYESRDGSTGGFFADNVQAGQQVWDTVNTLLRLDRNWVFGI